jgi:hypothetical protein
MKKTLLVLTAAILTISLASATDLRNIEQITPVGSQDLGVNGTLDMKSNPITGINGLNNCTADQALLGDGSCGSTGSSAEKDLTTSGGLTGGQNDVLAGTDGDVDLSIASQGVGQSELNTNIAGTGLSGGGGSALAVNWADATDLDSNGDLLTDAVQNDEILNSQVTVSSGNHLSGGGNVFLGGSTTLDVQDDFLLNSGDTMNGDLNMNGNSIENASRIYASQGSYIGQTNDYDISGNTAKWVRFANASRGRHAGIFRVRWTGAAHHGSLLFRVSEVYGNLDTSSMTMIGHDYDYYGNAKSSATKVRIVENNTNSRVYVEVYMNNTEQWNLKMQVDQLTKGENGWNLISLRESSVPSSTPTQVMSTKGSFAVNDNQDIFKVSKNGNVGIKTSSPSTALDINGSLSVAGTECAADQALLGDGTCGSTGGGTQNLKQVLTAGNTANQSIDMNGNKIKNANTTQSFQIPVGSDAY